MTAWRDGLSTQAQDDLDGLLNACLELAEQQLRQRGELFPFVLAADLAGHGEMILPDPDAVGADPDTSRILAACRAAVQTRRDSLRAAALTAAITVSGGGDGVRVELQHAEGASLTVETAFIGGVEGAGFGELHASGGGDAGLR